MNDVVKKLQAGFFVVLGVAIPTSIAVTGIIFGCLGLFWLLEGNFKAKKKLIVSSKWMLVLLGLIIYYGAGMFWGDNHNNSSWVFQKITLLIMFVVLGTSNFEQKTLKFGAIAFLTTTFISAIIAIAIDFELLLPLHNYTDLISLNIIDYKSAFIKYNYHNIFLSFSALLSFYLLIEKKTKYPIILILLILSYSWSIFSEAGRAGHLIFILLFIVYSAYYIKENRLVILGMIGFFSILIIGAYKFSRPFKVRIDEGLETVLNKGKRPGHVKEIRYVFVEESFRYIKQRPLLGYGTGSFGTIFKREVTSEEAFYKHTTPHNNYLYIWFELGIVGLLLLLSLFYFQIKELLVLKDGRHRIILPLIFLVIMFVDSFLYIFIITSFYIYFYTIYRKINLHKPS
jgi:O-antigen ligase